MSSEAAEPPAPEEPQDFLPTWDVATPEAASAKESVLACPACQAARRVGQIYCVDCGFVFPQATTDAQSPSMPPPQRVGERYEIGAFLSERDGMARFQAYDMVAERPVVVARAACEMTLGPVLEAAPAEDTFDADRRPIPPPPAAGGEGQGEGGENHSESPESFDRPPLTPDPSPPRGEGGDFLPPLTPDPSPPRGEGSDFLPPLTPDPAPPRGEGSDFLPPLSPDPSPPRREGSNLLQPVTPDPSLPRGEGGNGRSLLASPFWPSIAWEQQVLEKAQHPSLPRILSHFTEEGWEYLVEELPEGQSLWDAWDDPAATNELRYYWLKQVAEALQALHGAGAMLEAIRPEMVNVTADGQARLTSVADLLPLPLPPRTPVRGTYYTAPELVLADEQADARANLYSFGGMLYALLVGRELAESDFERAGVPKPFLSVFPDSHPQVGRLLSKTFCRDVQQRFPTEEQARVDPTGFTELAQALDSCRRTLDRVRLEIAAWTTTGMVRSGNEDAFYLLHATEGREDDVEDSALVLLADGMGGAEAGEVAAALAIRSLRGFLMRKKTVAAMCGRAVAAPFDRRTCERLIVAALRRANRRVVKFSVERTGRPGNAGCTAEVVWVRGRDLVVGHVGDSRVYLYQDGRILQVTRDQTMVNRMVDLGMLTPEEAETHPERSDLAQALGGRDELEPALYHHTLKAGAWVLVCSDGLVNHLSVDDLQHIFEREAAAAEAAARRLVNYANLRGGIDNTTVVVIRVC